MIVAKAEDPRKVWAGCVPFGQSAAGAVTAQCTDGERARPV